MATKKLDILVVGGSLGGLFVGVILKRLGHRVRIFERNPTKLLHNQGAGIVAAGDTLAFFEKYDRTKTKLAIESPYRHYLNQDGEEISRQDWLQKMTSWDLVYNLLRANFDELDTGYCIPAAKQSTDGNATYEYGHVVTSVEEKGDSSVQVSFRNRDGTEDQTVVDLVIGADGPSSTIRSIFEPSVTRDYAGYLAWRGTAPESELSASAEEAFSEKFTFFHREGVQALAYLIPGEKGSTKPGERLLNFLVYENYAEGSSELNEIMTDLDGIRHRVTLPPGKMKPDVWEKQKAHCMNILPFQFAEVVQKIAEPFVQAVTDVRSPRATFLNGKILLVGDAISGFRPHTAASTNQAARNAMSLGKYLEGMISLKDWEAESLEYAERVQEHGIMLGQRSQFGDWRPLSKKEAQSK